MRTTHTPGPWTTGGFANIVVNSADGFTIVACPCGSPNAAIAEIKANAALIAAAPELLSSLEECAYEIQFAIDNEKNIGSRLEIALLNCNAAIAKAKGGAL